MSAKSDPRAEAEARRAVPRFYYRRSVSARELLPAAGIAVAAGLLAFYVARIFAQRTPLDSRPTERHRPARIPRSTGG